MIPAGVTWTLYYEWLFYISLPFLAIAALRRSVLSFIPAIAWLYVYSPTVFSGTERYFVALFACGMFAASMVRRFPRICGDNSVKSLIGISLLISLFASSKTAYAWASDCASWGVLSAGQQWNHILWPAGIARCHSPWEYQLRYLPATGPGARPRCCGDLSMGRKARNSVRQAYCAAPRAKDDTGCRPGSREANTHVCVKNGFVLGPACRHKGPPR